MFESWFRYIRTLLREFKDFLNAPGNTISVNGNGCDGELNTAAYPRNDMYSLSSSTVERISNSLN